MKLSLQFLYLKISEKLEGVTEEAQNSEACFLESARLYTHSLFEASTSGSTGSGFPAIPDPALPDIGTPGETEELLYVILPDRDTRDAASVLLPSNIPLLLTRQDSFAFPLNPKIIVPDGSDLYGLFNLILTIFQSYNTWAEKVGTAIIENKSLQEILELSVPIIGNPMYIADLSFKMLAWINMDLDEISAVWRYQIRYGYLPYNTMMDLVETGELELLNNTIPAFYIRCKSFHNPFISKTIHYKSKTQGHFFIIEIYKKLTQCDIELAEYLGNLLSAATYDKRNYLSISSFYHEHFMVDILEGTLTDTTLIRNQLGPLGWKLDGSYRVFLLYVPEDADALKRHITAFLLDGFDSQAFLYQDYLVVIYNHNTCPEQALFARLEKITDVFNRSGAVSEVFHRFDRMFLYYQQAVFALQEGRKKGRGDTSFFLYEDFFTYHLGKLCKSSFPCYYYAELLHTYDETHHTQYCLTLFTYLLNERNAVKTAQTLYLHRNTLKYRLEKIDGLIPVDLDNPSVRFRLLTSLYVTVISDQ